MPISQILELLKIEPCFSIIIVDGGDNNTNEILETYLKEFGSNFLNGLRSILKVVQAPEILGLQKLLGNLSGFLMMTILLTQICWKNGITELKNIKNDFCRFERTVFYNLNLGI